MSPLFRPTGRPASPRRSFRPRTPAHHATPAVVAVAAAAVLALSGCGPDPASPGTASPTSSETSAPAASDIPGATVSPEPTEVAPATPSDPDPATATEEQMTDLLQLHARLKTELGTAYSDAWIEGGQLHVGVTTPEAEAVVYGAGAIPVRAEFTEQQLREATDAFKAWLATDAAPPVELHWLGTSGRTGSITVRVPADQVQPLADAVAAHSPAGAVTVVVEESSGPATPLGTTAP